MFSTPHSDGLCRIKTKHLYSDIHTLGRVEITRDLRMGEFDCLVGVNLLREGLDIPEVSLVAILDADKEGFLRSARSLIQTSGRAARNVAGQVIMYADTVTAAIRTCLDETRRRRLMQTKFNEEHGITPETIKTEIRQILGSVYEADYVTVPTVSEEAAAYASEKELPAVIRKLKEEMKQAAKALEFEKAAELRDRIRDLTKLILEMGGEG